MITDADIKKMKKVFATKDDLKEQTAEILKGVADYVSDSLIPRFEEHDKRFDRIDKELHINSLID